MIEIAPAMLMLAGAIHILNRNNDEKTYNGFHGGGECQTSSHVFVAKT